MDRDVNVLSAKLTHDTLSGLRGVSTPSETSKPGVGHSTVLISADHTLYRSATMRLCEIALDGPDLQFLSKDLARWTQAPTVGNLVALNESPDT